jgi:hypothetical protein
MKYKIQMLFSYGWDDESDFPCLYDSKEEAEDELKEHIACQEGPMEDRMRSDDYRVVPAE